MHNQHVSDNDLIVSYKNGDESSLRQLVIRHQERIFTSILILVKNRELAEDLFQDVFIKIVHKLKTGKYKEEGRFLGWALCLAHNLTIDHFRKEKHMPMVYDTDEFSIVDNIRLTENNAEQKLEVNQTNEILKNLIEKLPHEQREVLIMRHYGDMSFKEIAEVMNVSINTALGRMRYALINLRRMIKKHNAVLE